MNPLIKGHVYMQKTITFLLQAPVLLTLLLLTPVSNAFAYIGPGAGMSVVGSLLSILATIVVAIGAILFWPLRKLMKRRKVRRNATAGADTVKSDTKKSDTMKSDTVNNGTMNSDTVSSDTVKVAADSTPDGH